MESPDPELNARKELLRILCEEQHGGIFKIPIAIYETKTCQHIRNAMPPLCNFKTLCVTGFTEKVLDGCGVDVIHRSPIAHEVIPCAPQLLQDELLQCDARQLLMCRSTTIMVNPMIGDRDATWRNVNLYCIASGLSPFQKRAGEATPRRANEHTPLPVGRATADAPFVAGAKTPVPAGTILRPRRQARRGRSTCHGARRAS